MHSYAEICEFDVMLVPEETQSWVPSPQQHYTVVYIPCRKWQPPANMSDGSERECVPSVTV